MNGDDSEVILNESLAFLGEQPVIDDNIVHYGPLTLQIAQKVSLPTIEFLIPAEAP